jgi:1,4-dihydroxy-2-naphthoate octaprenyltransferase
MINPEGTGTGIFLVPFLTWGFLFIVLCLLGRLKSLRARIFFISLMAVHYLINILFVSNLWDTPYNGGSRIHEGKSSLLVSWEHSPEIILFLVAWYALGQAFLWVKFFEEVKNRNQLIRRKAVKC